MCLRFCDAMSDKLAPQKRFRCYQKGRIIYEWDQNIEEVNLYIPLPEGLPSKVLFVKLEHKHIELGVQGNPPYLSHDLGGAIKLEESFWTVEDGILHVTLQKRVKAATWSAALGSHEIQELDRVAESERLMLERFQTEHPGFDFSDATISGLCPNPSSFLGGVGHK